jgi:hypothetical protein
VREVERYWRITGTNAEAVCNGGMRTVPLRKEVAASCVTTAKLDTCAILHSFVNTLVRPGVQECAFCKRYSKHYYKEYKLLSVFWSESCRKQMKLGMRFKLIYYLTYAEPSRKTVKYAILPPFPYLSSSVSIMKTNNLKRGAKPTIKAVSI